MVPDDDPPDAFDDDPTNLDRNAALADRSGPVPVSERNTGTYSKSPEFLAGREAGYESGFKSGVDKVVAALRVELVRAGCTKEEIANILARIRGAIEDRR